MIRLESLVKKEFAKILRDLGYPVSPMKHVLAEGGYIVFVLSMYIMITLQLNGLLSSVWLFIFGVISIISLITFVVNYHYFGNY